jgi:hypothetical protein
MKQMKRHFVSLAMGLTVATSIVSSARAQDKEAPRELRAAEAWVYVGAWTLKPEGGAASMELRLASDGRELSAEIAMEAGAAPRRIDRMMKTETGISLHFTAAGEGERIEPRTLSLQPDGPGLAGALTRGDNETSANIIADRKSGSALLTDTTADRSRGRSSRAAHRIGAGRQIAVEFPPLPAPAGDLSESREEYAALDRIRPGQTLTIESGAAMRLRTDADLHFGETKIPRGNVAADYPGVYSLWLKRVEAGWRLVFNNEADIWGTQHNPKADAAEVRLTEEIVDHHFDRMQVDMTEQEDGRISLSLSWGSRVWGVAFSIAPRL